MTADILARIESLHETIRDHAAEGERNCNAAQSVIDQLEDAGLYRMTRATRCGGVQATLDERFAVLHEIARADPALAWMASIHLDGIWIAGTMRDEFQGEVFAESNPRLSGAFAPTGSARRVADGVILSGRWDFNTGSRYSSWLLLTAMVEQGDGVPEPALCAVPRQDTTSLDTWDTMGMSATGSHTTVVKDIFVPDHRVKPVAEFMSGVISSELNHADPYFRTLPVQYITAGLTGALVGAARGAMELFLQRLPGRSIVYTDYSSQSEAALTHSQVGTAELDIQSAEMFARRNNAHVNEMTDGDVPIEARALTRAYSGQVATLSRSAITTLFNASGASAIQRAVPIQRYFRDISAIALHGFLQPSSTTELYGRTLVGLPPNSTFI